MAITAGATASSTALIGFGLDSLIEVSSAAPVAWQFSARDHAVREAREKLRCGSSPGRSFSWPATSPWRRSAACSASPTPTFPQGWSCSRSAWSAEEQAVIADLNAARDTRNMPKCWTGCPNCARETGRRTRPRGNATYAEVEESEADLERFCTWLAKIVAGDMAVDRRRDRPAAPHRAQRHHRIPAEHAGANPRMSGSCRTTVVR